MVTHNAAGKHRRLGIGLIVLFVLLGAIAGGLASVRQDSQQTTLALGTGQYTVRVVSEASDREQGLSGTAELLKDQGMLFVFSEDNEWGIWMKDMRYSIDILWLDQSKTVVDVAANVSPQSYPSTVFKPKKPARYVLELAAGSIADASIAVGSQAAFSEKVPRGAWL